jgi:hypothetical protein
MPWPLLLATSDGACSIRRQQTGDDMTKSKVHIPETIDEDSLRQRKTSGQDGITMTISGSSKKVEK